MGQIKNVVIDIIDEELDMIADRYNLDREILFDYFGYLQDSRPEFSWDDALLHVLHLAQVGFFTSF